MSRLKKISEFLDGVEYCRGEMISLYKNPTSREIDEAKSEAWNSSIRGIIDGNDIYCWRGDILHDQLEQYLEEESKLLFSPTDGFRFSYDKSNSSWIFDIHYIMSYVEFFSEIKNHSSTLKNFGDLTGEINLYYADEGPQYEFEDYNISELNSCGIELNSSSITLFNGINSIESFFQNNLKTANKIKRLRRISSVPTLQDFYVPYEYDYIDIGLQTVEVSKIVGISNGRNEEYNSDFSPINNEDPRWIYQKDIVENGGVMEPVPLIKMPDGNYVGNGDGSHRISVAKVLNLATIEANVSVMVPAEDGIDEEWQKHSEEKRKQLDDWSNEYKQMSKQVEQKMNEALESNNMDIYNEFMEKYYELGDKISTLDHELIDEEKIFKKEFIEQYL